MRFFVLTLALFLALPVTATDPEKKMVLSSSIYQDLTGAPEQKLAELTRRKIETCNLLNMAAIDLEATKRTLNTFEWRRFFMKPVMMLCSAVSLKFIPQEMKGAMLGYLIAGKDQYHWSLSERMQKSCTQPARLVRAFYDNEIFRRMYEYTVRAYNMLNACTEPLLECAAPTQAIREKLNKILSQIRGVKTYLLHGPVTLFENRYLLKKEDFPDAWQERIENLLIEAYDQGNDFKHFDLLGDLIDHPLGCTSYRVSEIRELMNKVSKPQLLREMLRDTQRCIAYLKPSESLDDELLEIADTLSIPCITVQNYDELQTGLVLKTLSGKTSNRMILVIKDIDTWCDQHENFMLTLLNSRQETLFSEYAKLTIDCYNLTVIGISDTPYYNLDNAFQSRITFKE